MANRLHSNDNKLLTRIAQAWFGIAAIGMLAFIIFILGFYGVRILSGNIAGWNDKQLITGYIAGDVLGNLMLGIHVLFAAVVTLCGLIQLLPSIRQKYPRIHHLSGRIFIALAIILALGGLWLVWVRGTQLSLISAISVSGNALVILLCVGLSLRFAIQRKIDLHRRWALRAFLVVNGVWFFRVGIMGWVLLNQSPRGMNNTLSGPADIALGFGSYLIPLAGLEAYFWAQRQTCRIRQRTVAVLLILLTLFMAAGIAGAIMVMWLPPLLK